MLENVKSNLIGSFFFRRLLVIFVHVRPKVTRVAVVFHELINVASGFVEDVAVIFVFGHVSFRRFV